MPAVAEEKKAEVPEKLCTGQRGVRCIWCKVVGKNEVRQNYTHGRRKRFCLACRREFTTIETPI